jgi:hypothetical protein
MIISENALVLGDGNQEPRTHRRVGRRLFAELSDGELPLVGDLRWSDAALGWIANWRLAVNGRGHRWSVSGVNYDEAFRNAVRGAARLLSGNGGPL